MLIILVHEKAKEIAILQALGAKRASVAAIFGFCGLFISVVGSLTGALLAIYTVKNINLLLQFLSFIQGFDVLNRSFYGDNIPSDVSFSSVSFVLVSTTVVALISAVVPAYKAMRQNPADALRGE